jgi:predicted permease
MGHLLADFRYAFRTLAKAPLAMLVTVVSLGLGIGATTFVFTVTNAFLFRTPGGVATADDLVTIYTSGADGQLYGGTSFPDYQTVLEEVPALAQVAAIRYGAVNLGEETPPRRLFAEIVTGNYFSVLGVSLPLGRGFLPEETRVGAAERVVVISHRLWQEQFAGRPDALGRTLRIDGHQFAVVGVAPESMVSRLLGLKVDVWVPLGIPGGTFRATPQALQNRGDRDFQVLARLGPETSLAQVEAQLSVMAQRLYTAYPVEWRNDMGEARVVTALDNDSLMPPTMRTVLGVLAGLLFALAGMILLIACSNVAGIFLARANQRRREMAVRISLGAGRGRILAMLLTESLVPALAGGLLGIVVAIGATRTVGSVQLPIGIPLEFDFTLDPRVLGFATLVSVLSALVFGLAPALEASRPDLVPSLKNVSGSAGKRPGRFGMRNLLIVAQVASSVVLLVGSGIAIRTLQGATAIDLGFSSDRIAIMSKALGADDADPEDIVRTARDLVTRLAALPDVEAAHITRSAEGTILASTSDAEIHVEGFTAPESGQPIVSYNVVTPGYLETLRVPLSRGRTFTDGDREGAPLVAVVNQAFVSHYWPGDAGLGQRFTVTNRGSQEDLTRYAEQTFEVVGVVGNGRYVDIEDGDVPFFWNAFYQIPQSHALLHVKGRTTAESMLRLLRTEVPLEADEYSMLLPTTYAAMISLQTAVYGVMGKVLGSGGVFGLVLVVVGIYGVVSFAVTARTREVAIRQAVGAKRNQVVRTVAREGIGLSLVGAVIGIAIAAMVSGIGESAVYGVSPLDPIAFAVPVSVLLAAAVAASVIPARRITKLDLMQVLREE